MRRGPDTALLAGTPPFDRYAERDLRPLVPHADRLRLRAGTTLAEEGRRARELVVLLAGRVAARRDGREAAAYGPGACFGAVEVVDGGTHAHTLVAATDVEVLVVAGPAYRWAVQELTPGRGRRRHPEASAAA